MLKNPNEQNRNRIHPGKWKGKGGVGEDMDIEWQRITKDEMFWGYLGIDERMWGFGSVVYIRHALSSNE
jgi:hypothetical protein